LQGTTARTTASMPAAKSLVHVTSRRLKCLTEQAESAEGGWVMILLEPMMPIAQPTARGRTVPRSASRAIGQVRASLPLAARFRPALLIALVAAWVACGPVRLVSPYDEAIDRGTSEIHTRITAFVERMTTLAGKPEGTYAANTGFYGDLKANVATLKLRAQAQGKNEITTALVGELATNVENLRKLHESSKDAGLPSLLASPALSAIEVNCAAIVKFEVAKRRGTQE
jgi:hypothetical protein